MEKTTTRDFIVFLAESRNQRLRPAQRLPRHCALWARAGRAPAGPRKDRRVVEACGPADGAGIPEGSGAEGDVCGLRASKYLSEAIAPKLQVLIEGWGNLNSCLQSVATEKFSGEQRLDELFGVEGQQVSRFFAYAHISHRHAQFARNSDDYAAFCSAI